MIGRTLGSYRIVEQIGLGGMATIYKAYDAATDRYVAVKTLPEYYSKDPTFRQRFEREAKAIAHMEHIHILPIFSYGEDAGIAYLVMRYMQTGTLADRIGQGQLPLAEASRMLTQIASALDYAHKNGILHRDVKPSNVLVDGEGNAFLTDFGIAKMVEGTSELTGSGLIGTPNYMSPEQCSGAKKLSPASDQYALGVVLYEMLTGSKPYQAETPVAVILMQLNDPLPSLRAQRADISEDMEAVLFKALAKQPELRYPTCSAMAEAFARAVSVAEPSTAIAQGRAATSYAEPTDRISGKGFDEGTLRVEPPAPPATSARARKFPVWAIGLAVVALGAVIAIAAGLPGQLVAAVRPTNTPTPTPTDLPKPTPTPASLIAGLTGTRNIFVCDNPSREVLCIGSVGTDQEPIRIETGLELYEVAWGPSGEEAIVTANEPGAVNRNDIDLYVVSMKDGSLRMIGSDHTNLMPAWSPDGQWLAYHSNGALSIIRPDGTGYRDIWWEQNECILQPQWSPDSQKIVFTSVRCGELPPTRRIFVATLDGIVTPIIEFTPPRCHDTRTAFSPDGLLVEYLDEACHAALLHADGTQTNVKIGDFNRLWRGDFFPQWGNPK